MAFVITSPCKDEIAAECIEVCPVDCIEEGDGMFYIDPDVCIDCAACESVCPASAIYFEADVPNQDEQYIQINADFFK